MTPEEYVASLDGWRHDCVTALRQSVLRAADFDEAVKWGHLVYTLVGPALLIRAEEERVRFGFWRGQRLLELEPRLLSSGKYEMATLMLTEDETVNPTAARRLAKEAAALNRRLGDPRDAARPAAKRKSEKRTSKKSSRSRSGPAEG